MKRETLERALLRIRKRVVDTLGENVADTHAAIGELTDTIMAAVRHELLAAHKGGPAPGCRMSVAYVQIAACMRIGMRPFVIAKKINRTPGYVHGAIASMRRAGVLPKSTRTKKTGPT